MGVDYLHDTEHIDKTDSAYGLGIRFGTGPLRDIVVA